MPEFTPYISKNIIACCQKNFLSLFTIVSRTIRRWFMPFLIVGETRLGLEKNLNEDGVTIRDTRFAVNAPYGLNDLS
jgi:hypothetical protein